VPGEVLIFIVERNDVEWIVNSDILNEYLTVLARPKFGLPSSLRLRWEKVFEAETTLVLEHVGTTLPRDPTDAKFVECAIASDADFLVTGDRDFSAAQIAGVTKIVSAPQFKRFVFDPLQRDR